MQTTETAQELFRLFATLPEEKRVEVMRDLDGAILRILKFGAKDFFFDGRDFRKI